MTRSMLKSKLVLGVALVVGSLAFGRSVQANEAVIAVPVSGGQFSVDLKIQNGVVQNYGYQNNQLPTLLSPVGTISLTKATAPQIVPTGFYWTSSQGTNPTQMERAKILTNLTGQTALNDGRVAKLSDSPSILYGFVTPSSPISVSDLGRITTGRNDNYNGRPITELPQNYNGTIVVQINSGSLLVPISTFSNPSNTVTKLEMYAGRIQTVYLGAKDNWKKEIEVYDGTSREFKKAVISEGDVSIFTENTLRTDVVLRQVGSNVPASSPFTAVTLLSPMGTTSLSLQYLTSVEVYPVGGKAQSKSSNSTRLPTVSAVANGTIMLKDGTVVNVANRLASFELENLFYPLYITSQDTEFLPRPLPQDMSVKQGHLYMDYVDPRKMSALSNIGELKNLNAISIPEPIQNFKLTSEATLTDILASPLTSSRILPDVGAFR